MRTVIETPAVCPAPDQTTAVKEYAPSNKLEAESYRTTFIVHGVVN